MKMKICPITPPTLCQSNFRKRLSIFGRWNIRNWKLLPSTLSMQHRKFQKIVSEYFQFSNGFLIFQKFSRSVENGWIEKLVSDSDLKILRNCKIKQPFSREWLNWKIGKRQRFEDFAELQNQGVCGFHHQAILYCETIYKISACNTLTAVVFSFCTFGLLEVKIEKNFFVVL